jgi:hypothetical protein
VRFSQRGNRRRIKGELSSKFPVEHLAEPPENPRRRQNTCSPVDIVARTHKIAPWHTNLWDFLTTDGEKPDRNRDTEFETPPQTRAGLVALWEAGWKICPDALESLTDEDLARTVTIRTEPHSVMQAINRQVGHYTHHVGQIVFLAKHFAGANWQTLSVPKRKSADFNRRVAAGEASQR